MSAGNRVYKSFKRLENLDVLQEFKDIPIPNIGDNEMRLGCVDSEIKSINHLRVIGQAYTVKVAPGDNVFFHIALDNAQEGDVLVVDGNGYTNRALCGEIMVNYAMKKKLGGFIINGAVRDPEAMQELDFPVFAKATSPNGPYKNGPGEINVPVVIGGKVIEPGDVIVGDNEGIVVIKLKDLDAVLAGAKATMAKEEASISNIVENGVLDFKWAYKVLEGLGTEIFEGSYEDDK